MSGSSDVFNIALGKAAYYADELLTGAADLVAVALTDGTTIVDDTLREFDTLAAVLAVYDESAAVSYARVDLTTVVVTPDDTNNRQDADADDIDWGDIEAGEVWEKVLICFVPDNGTPVDANTIPLTYHAVNITTNGGNVTTQVANFFRAQ